MEFKQMCLFVFFLGLLLNHVEAVFFYNPEDLESYEINGRVRKCIPGRTSIKVAKTQEATADGIHSEYDGRRKHMTKKSDDKTCQVCVCSADGVDEYCSNRPARNVNECILVAKATDDYNRNSAFNHEKTLSHAIRRGGDYLWHKDEIPYEPHAKCRRGFSYYSNSITANDTDIDVGSDVDSLVGYNNADVCSFCVCSVGGNAVACIARDQWFCEYYRVSRNVEAFSRNVYTTLLKQDRPAYFRQLSFRMRRNMDMSISEYMEIANRGLTRPSCIPFVSEYNDCNKVMTCKGCTRCSCNVDGQWTCYKTLDTCGAAEVIDLGVGDEELAESFANLAQEIRRKEEEDKMKEPRLVVPLPRKRTRKPTPPPAPLGYQTIEQRLGYVLRPKRSVHNETETGVKFHHTLDEINADTLKNSNVSGTLGVQKVDIYTAKAARRSGVLDNSSQNPLHIVYNHPKVNHHITDNKIESSHTEDKYDDLGHEKLHKISGNYTQKTKNNDLSKVVVNELKTGTETIGDTQGPIMSNITFTRENDTLTAMAFIAGNLLNRLWNIEKDSNHDSIETELMKHEKISDLLELFKEPMTLRQEQFLKAALEKLADALNKNKDIKNISLCNTVEEMKKDLISEHENKYILGCDSKQTKSVESNDKTSVVHALSKIQNVLSLMKKFEEVQKNIQELKRPQAKSPIGSQKAGETEDVMTKDEEGSFDVYGNILEKITKLLLPENNKRNKGKFRDRKIIYNSRDVSAQEKKAFNIELDDLKLTSKDKMILDYINNMQTNPCILSTLRQESMPIRNIESNILLNLSEFFKIKSFSDLMKIVDPEKHKSDISHTATSPSTSTTEKEFKVPKLRTKEIKNNNSTQSLKDRLKAHLKAIINDLIEVQREKGNNLRSGDINIADALPCLVNMLKNDKSLEKSRGNFRIDLMNKVKSVLDVVKKETKKMPQNRRALGFEPRPKSALIWERVVKNLARRSNTRRNFKSDEPKSFDEVKKLMDRIDSESSNTYKNFAFLYEVPAADKLVLLQALDVDINRNVDVLEKLQTLNIEKKLPANKLDDILDFVDNTASSILLNDKVLRNLNSPKQKRFRVETNNSEIEFVVTPASMLDKQALVASADTGSNSNEYMKITRDEILNQLIKNRVELYLKIKEAQGVDKNGDMKYNIAKRIIANLDNGNHKLAQELFSVFVDNKRQAENAPALPSLTKANSRNSILNRKPLKPAVDSKSFPDQLLKGFLNFKSS